MHSRLETGFSLLQLSIVMAIIAVMGVALLPVQQSGQVNGSTNLTVNRTERVEIALKLFATRYGRLPCPADATLSTEHENFGKEAANPGNCTGGVPNSTFGPDNDIYGTGVIGFVVGGMLPTRTLQIPDEYAMDGFNNRYSYYVDRRATEAYSCGLLRQGELDVVDDNGNALKNMYVLISHGANGHGAFPDKGSHIDDRFNSGSSDVSEADNASVDALFSRKFDWQFVKKQFSPTYDDLTIAGVNCCYGSMCRKANKTYDGPDVVSVERATGKIYLYKLSALAGATSELFSTLATISNTDGSIPLYSTVALSNDNRFFLIRGKVYIRNGNLLEQINEYGSASNYIMDADFSDGGSTLAFGQYGFSHVEIKHLEAEKKYVYGGQLVVPAAFSSLDLTDDGKYLAVSYAASAFGDCARIYKNKGGMYDHLTGPNGLLSSPCVQTIDASSGRRNQVKFTNDGDFLAVTAGSVVTIFARKDGDKFELVHQHTAAGHINNLSWSHDNRFLAIASDDTTSTNGPDILKRKGKIFFKLQGNDAFGVQMGPVGFISPPTAKGVSFSRDSRYLIVTFDTSPYIGVFVRRTDRFQYMTSSGLGMSHQPYVDGVAFRR